MATRAFNGKQRAGQGPMIDQKKNDLKELRVWQTLGGWWKVKDRSRANSEMGKGPTVWQTLGQDGDLYIYL